MPSQMPREPHINAASWNLQMLGPAGKCESTRRTSAMPKVCLVTVWRILENDWIHLVIYQYAYFAKQLVISCINIPQNVYLCQQFWFDFFFESWSDQSCWIHPLMEICYSIIWQKLNQLNLFADQNSRVFGGIATMLYDQL